MYFSKFFADQIFPDDQDMSTMSFANIEGNTSTINERQSSSDRQGLWEGCFYYWMDQS
jgi:hypothetical protein